MKNIIRISGLAIVMIAMFLNTNSVDNSNGDLDLASLATMNVANAEQTLDCYGSYTTGGSWVIIKCNGCVQKAHVNQYEQKSTCTN